MPRSAGILVTPARLAAGVTPAPTVHTIQSQNPEDGILLQVGGDGLIKVARTLRGGGGAAAD